MCKEAGSVYFTFRNFTGVSLMLMINIGITSTIGNSLLYHVISNPRIGPYMVASYENLLLPLPVE